MRYAYQAYLFLQHFEFMSFVGWIRRLRRIRHKKRALCQQSETPEIFLSALFLLQHKVILNTHFHIPVIQAIAQRTAIALFPPFIGSKKEIHPL